MKNCIFAKQLQLLGPNSAGGKKQSQTTAMNIAESNIWIGGAKKIGKPVPRRNLANSSISVPNVVTTLPMTNKGGDKCVFTKNWPELTCQDDGKKEANPACVPIRAGRRPKRIQC